MVPGDHGVWSLAREVVLTLAEGDVFPGELRRQLAGAALLAGIPPVVVAPLLEDGPHVCRVVRELAGRLLLLEAEHITEAG